MSHIGRLGSVGLWVVTVYGLETHRMTFKGQFCLWALTLSGSRVHYSLGINAGTEDIQPIAVKRMGYGGAEVARYLGVTTSAVNQIAISEELPIIEKYSKLL